MPKAWQLNLVVRSAWMNFEQNTWYPDYIFSHTKFVIWIRKFQKKFWSMHTSPFVHKASNEMIYYYYFMERVWKYPLIVTQLQGNLVWDMGIFNQTQTHTCKVPIPCSKGLGSHNFSQGYGFSHKYINSLQYRN